MLMLGHREIDSIFWAARCTNGTGLAMTIKHLFGVRELRIYISSQVIEVHSPSRFLTALHGHKRERNVTTSDFPLQFFRGERRKKISANPLKWNYC